MLAAVSFTAVLALYAYYHEVGWVVMIAIYGLIAWEVDIRRNPRVFVAIAAVVFIHQMAAVFNLVGHMLPGAETDARTFLVYAQNRDIADIEPAISIDLYRNFLIIILELQDGARSAAFSSSVLAFSLGMLLFNRLITLAGIEHIRIPVLIAFGLMPHVVVYTSITLREPLQFLFFIGAVYYGVSFRNGAGAIDAVFFFLCAVCLAMLHQVLIPFALLMMGLILIWPAAGDSWARITTRVVAAVVVVGVAAAASIYLMRSLEFTGVGIVLKMAEFDVDYFLRQIEGYRLAIERDNPRSALNVTVDTDSLASLVLSTPALYLGYWLAPFPWNIENAKDGVAATLSLLRLGLFCLIVTGFFADRGNKRLQVLLLLLFLLMCSTWILGTTNYGQAIRHQVLSDWLLLLVAGAFVERRLTRSRPLGING